MFIFVGVISVSGVLVICYYENKKKKTEKTDQTCFDSLMEIEKDDSKMTGAWKTPSLSVI